MPTTETLPTFAEYVNGDESTRLTFERAYPTERNYEHERVYEPWDTETADRERAIARQLIAGDEWHRRGHSGQAVWERMSCGTCALLGYEPRGGWDDGYSVKRDGPNYAGWQRAYVQAGRRIPAKWRVAFSREEPDYAPYWECLGRDLVTFGHPGFSV